VNPKDISNADFTPMEPPLKIRGHEIDYMIVDDLHVEEESYGALLARQKKEQQQYLHSHRAADYTPKTYVKESECVTAVGHVLDTGEGASPALEHTASKHELEGDWIGDVKHNKSFHTKKALQAHEGHATIQELKVQGLLKRSTVSNLVGSNTFSGMLNQLSMHVSTAKRLDNLESAVLDLTNRVGDLEGFTKIHETPKEYASTLKARGCTQAQVAEEVGKGIATIKRWWKDI
jgi:hypothetical protein